MQIDSLSYLSRAIEAALDAVTVPALLLLGVAGLMMAAVEIRAHVRRRRRRAARTMPTARQTRLERARGAEA